MNGKDGAPADRAERARRITRTSFIGIAANALLSGFKAAVGMVSGSVAIALDSLNNLADALSAVITIVGVKIAGLPPDKKHPFGHGRAEYFTAITIATLVISAGAGALMESARKIVHPAAPEYGAASIAIVSVAVVAKFLLGRYVSARAQGKAHRGDIPALPGQKSLHSARFALCRLTAARPDGGITSWRCGRCTRPSPC
ncbi:MAG: cation diffusion facilitator family transporter [Kiritimatiellae bacterium]|nr:cation diffusion facilitator family transporter [Kiritimatiellia bacterium]